jgi:hypothetical protein
MGVPCEAPPSPELSGGGEIVSWSYQAVTPDVIKLVVARELSPTGPLVGTARFRMVGESPRETMQGHSQ